MIASAELVITPNKSTITPLLSSCFRKLFFPTLANDDRGYHYIPKKMFNHPGKQHIIVRQFLPEKGSCLDYNLV